jgi:hypothetical protein
MTRDLRYIQAHQLNVSPSAVVPNAFIVTVRGSQSWGIGSFQPHGDNTYDVYSWSNQSQLVADAVSIRQAIDALVQATGLHDFGYGLLSDYT